MPNMRRSELYHVGIIVPDLEEAQARLSALLGLAWGPILDVMTPVRDAEGRDAEVRSRVCFSTEAPRFELITETPGTPWVCNEFSNIHHVGFYSDDVPGDSGALSTARCPFEFGSRFDTETPPDGWAYHRDDQLGIRVEYVGEAIRPMMEEFLFKPAPEEPHR